jgi:ABC-2 type transport system ATP-binding protein
VTPRVAGSPALEAQRLRAGHGRRSVLDGVDLRIGPGEWYTLLGPNGAGKSTLLDVCTGRHAPWSGAVAIGGHALHPPPSAAADPAAAKRLLGHGCAPDQLPGLLTPRQCLEVHAAAKGLPTLDASVLAFAETLAFTAYLDEWVDTLSLGTRQKLSVLLALVGDPALIVLDEAFNGLDAASSLQLKRELRRRVDRGSALLLATHSLDVVERHADRAGLLAGGRLVREWSRDEISALRAAGGDALESAIAGATAGAIDPGR